MNKSDRTAFLPVSKEDMAVRGIEQLDFVYISGDAYVDHPSFGTAIISRILEANGFTVGIIALFIVFQPELREALEKMGNTSVNLRRFNNSIHENSRIMHAVDEIVDACCAMSRECCGALIVIDRTTGLRDFISSGTKIDAEISSYLLRNIFLQESYSDSRFRRCRS